MNIIKDEIRDKGLTLLFIMMCAFWTAILFISITAIMPVTPISHKSPFIHAFYPQGWGFFSKNPRDATVHIFNMDGDQDMVVWPNNRPKNFFGLIRYGRAQGTEMGELTSKIPKSKWSSCQKGAKYCLSQINPQLTIRNTDPMQSLCGDLGIASIKPIPWAFGSMLKEKDMPSTIVRVNVECSGN